MNFSNLAQITGRYQFSEMQFEITNAVLIDVRIVTESQNMFVIANASFDKKDKNILIIFVKI